MQQHASTGRNEPCPCGSGRKYKKCCLGSERDAIASVSTDARLQQLVERAIEDDDWSPIDPHVDRVLELLEPGQPLEHVRFRDDLIRDEAPSRSELARLCSNGWLPWFERELAQVLGGEDLEPAEREALEVALYLTRRFGALSPVVEELARRQFEVHADRMHRLEGAVDSLGREGVLDGARASQVLQWVEQDRPPVLRFAEWFALCAAGEQIHTLWLSTLATRACDACLDQAERAAPADRANWVLLALLVAHTKAHELPRILMAFASLRDPAPDELLVKESMMRGEGGAPAVMEALTRIRGALAENGDFVSIALLDDAFTSSMRHAAKTR